MSAESFIVLAVLCFGAAVILFLMELVIPSGGILGVLAAVALVAGVVFLFLEDTTYGLYGAIVTIAVLPFALYGGLSLWARSPLARWVMLNTRQSALTLRQVSADDGEESEAPVHPRAALVGKTGKVISDLRPVGVCNIAGERLECHAQVGVITRGTPVRVVAVEGMQTIVRPVEAG